MYRVRVRTPSTNFESLQQRQEGGKYEKKKNVKGGGGQSKFGAQPRRAILVPPLFGSILKGLNGVLAKKECTKLFSYIVQRMLPHVPPPPPQPPGPRLLTRSYGRR